jgi:HEAT repeat protein
MKDSRGLRVALSCAVLGGLLVAGSAYVLKGPILEGYYLRKLASKESQGREAAAMELARLRSYRAAEPILRLAIEVELYEQGFDVPRPPGSTPRINRYEEALKELGGRALPALVKARKAGDLVKARKAGGIVRRLLGETLERVSGDEVGSDPRLRAAVLEALRDPANEIRWQAAQAVGRTRPLPAEAVPLLEALLEDGSGDVRRAAAEALGRPPRV